MKVLVDTSIWSHGLRRRTGGDAASTAELASLVQDGRVAMIGPIRQELLSGIKERAHFERLREHLSAFPDTEILSDSDDSLEVKAVHRRDGLARTYTLRKDMFASGDYRHLVEVHQDLLKQVGRPPFTVGFGDKTNEAESFAELIRMQK